MTRNKGYKDKIKIGGHMKECETKEIYNLKQSAALNDKYRRQYLIYLLQLSAEAAAAANNPMLCPAVEDSNWKTP